MPLPVPTAQQREVLYLPPRGHVVVLGSAGSGKTTLAILRSAHLADPITDHNGNTLLLTFNRALVTYFRHLREQGQLAQVETLNYHRFARGYLNSRGRMRNNCIAGPNQREELIGRVHAELARNGDRRWQSLLARGGLFLSEEFSWIQRHGIRTLDDYLGIARTGRQAPLTQGQREFIFGAYARYRELRGQTGLDYDWDDLAMAVSDEFDRDTDARMYRHAVIDEGQDFSPEMLRSLVKAVPADGSLTFFGDVAQQIYGKRMSWRSAGLNVTRVWEFSHNFRNSRQIAGFARSITEHALYQGDEDLVAPITPVADGPLPTFVTLPNIAAERAFVLDQARNASRTRSVAVLFRRREDEQWIADSTPGAIRLHRDLATWQSGPALFYGTYHSAKGLEFDVVILPFLTAQKLPHTEDVTALGLNDAAAGDLKLLYVACTRARTNLILTHSSAVSPLIPIGSEFLQRIN